MRRANRILAWIVIWALVVSAIGMYPIRVNAAGLEEGGKFYLQIKCQDGMTVPSNYGIDYEFFDSSNNSKGSGRVNGSSDGSQVNVEINVPTDAQKIVIKVVSAGNDIFYNGVVDNSWTDKTLFLQDITPDTTYQFQLQPLAGGGGAVAPPLGEVGKIAFDINAGGNVSYSTDGTNWTGVVNGEKAVIAGACIVYLKAEPDESNGKILDTNNQQYYSCDNNRTDITDLDALKNGTYSFLYDPAKAYNVQIRFDNGGGGAGGGAGDPGPQGPEVDVSLSVTWTGEFGDIIVGGRHVTLGDGSASLTKVNADQTDNTKIKVVIQAEPTVVYSSLKINGEEKVPTGETKDFYELLIPVSDKSLTIVATKGESTQGTIVWAYDSVSFGADAFVEHGTVEMVDCGIGDINPSDTYFIVDFDSSVTVKLIPDYGYQVVGAKINGEIDLTANESENEFTFAMPHGNVHFQGIFTPTADIVENDASSVVSSAEFSGDKIATSGGTAKMTIDPATASDISSVSAVDSTKSVQAVDITMDQLFYKNSASEVWSTNKSELEEEAEVKLKVNQASTGYAVLREHNGEVERIYSEYDSATNTITFNSNKYSTYTLVPLTENVTPMDGFPASFGAGTLNVDSKNRVDMDNNNDPGNFASGEFSVATLPSGMTLNELITQYKTINFNAKIIDNPNSCKVSEVSYRFDVEVNGEMASIEFVQGYASAIALTVGNNVTFTLDMDQCKTAEKIFVNVPPGWSYNDIKDATISAIACNFKLSTKGSVSYVAPNAVGFAVDTTKPYLNIVIPAMEVRGEYASWGGWNNIKAVYNAEENKGTGFTTYQDLFTNYKGIKIKVDVSNIDPLFNKDNEIFFYLHDPMDGMQPGTVGNGVKYDITDAHTNRQYVNKDGGVQEFVFDFAGTYYMDGSAAPDIWLSMGTESHLAEGEAAYDVRYCDIKPVIENANGTISLGTGCSKMQFTDASNTANGGLMDVEKATTISLNVSNESGALAAIDGEGTPSDAKQAELKTLIDADSEMGTDDSATKQIKQVVEINLSVNGTEIQPKNNNVNVSIPVSKFNIADTSKMKLYHHVNGVLVEITGVEVKDGKISFDTPSFSYFVVVEDNEPAGGFGGEISSPAGSPSTGAGVASPNVTAINTSNAGGLGQNLESSMLVKDIGTAASGSTLVIDRRYNRQYLSNAEMKALLNKGTVSLCMQYNYGGKEYSITIPAGTAMNDNIPYYGPLYLAALYPATNIFLIGDVQPFASYNGSATIGVITGIYIARPGDTFSKIAKKYGLTIQDLRIKNPQIKNINMIYVGQPIYI